MIIIIIIGLMIDDFVGISFFRSWRPDLHGRWYRS